MSEQSEEMSLGGGVVHMAGPGPVVNLWQCWILVRRSRMVTRFKGSSSKIERRISSSSADNGKMVLKNLGFLRYARNVLSEGAALFHGFRPHVRFTRITPRDHTSLGAEA